MISQYIYEGLELHSHPSGHQQPWSSLNNQWLRQQNALSTPICWRFLLMFDTLRFRGLGSSDFSPAFSLLYTCTVLWDTYTIFCHQNSSHRTAKANSPINSFFSSSSSLLSLFIHSYFQPAVIHYPTIFHKDSERIHLVQKVSVKPLSQGLRQRHNAPLFMLKMK